MFLIIALMILIGAALSIGRLLSSTASTKREKEEKEIIDELLLLHMSQDGASRPPIPVIIIWGVQGIGKTTLAEHVCSDERIEQHLGFSVWIKGTKYKTFDLDTIAKDVNHGTTSSSSSSSRNRIVVLDNWSIEIGDQDVKALQDKLNNVKAIMITTRDPLVAIPRNIAASPVKSYALFENSMTLFQKTCFTYLSLFPQHYEFDAESLIHLWMAEGFLQEEKTGRTCLRDLVERHIFETVEFDEFSEVKKCRKMKRSMLKRAISIAVRENIFVDGHQNNAHQQVKLASFTWNTGGAIPTHLFSNATTIKSLILFGPGSKSDEMKKAVLNKVFQGFEGLCVLHLRDMGIKQVPSSIEKLKDLKYLDLSVNTMKKLPDSITKLSKLETLKLFDCQSLKELPKDFKDLAQLKHLDVEGCTNLTCMPHKMGEMSSLQTLSTFVASNNRRTGGLEELETLNQLRGHLQILHLERVKSAPKANFLEDKERLERLTLIWDYKYPKTENDRHRETLDLQTLDCLKPNSALRVLILFNYQRPNLPIWLTCDHLQHLVMLKLSGCNGCKYLSEDDELPKLEILELVNLNNLEYITHNCDEMADIYRTLKKLKIEGCRKLKRWWETAEEENNRPFFTSTPELHFTDGDCSLQKRMPPFQRRM